MSGVKSSNAENTPSSSRELRIAIGAICGYDLRERVDSVGNSPAAVQFRKQTLRSIAMRIPNRRGDARNITEMTCGEMQEFISRNLGFEPPNGHFRWNHLKAIYEEVSRDV